ncbi:hypothetical protein HispidOSU_023451 [Sigmodon hispidus]
MAVAQAERYSGNTFPVFLLRLGSHWAQLPVRSRQKKLRMAEAPGISEPEHASVVSRLSELSINPLATPSVRSTELERSLEPEG